MFPPVFPVAFAAELPAVFLQKTFRRQENSFILDQMFPAEFCHISLGIFRR